MEVVLGVLVLIVIVVAVYFWNQLEEEKEYVMELEERIDKEKYEKDVLVKRVCEVVFEEPHLGSVKNLQNRVKTILENLIDPNIV